MSHELTAVDLPQLAERLDVITAGLGDLLTHVRLDDISDSSNLRWRWGWSDLNEPDLERWHRGESLSLAGIGSMTILLGRHSLTFGCWIRWVEFVRDKHIQKLTRQIVFRFARFFHSKKAIYLPDSNSLTAEGAQNRVADGAHIDELLAYLAQSRPAATSIESICTPVTSSVGGRTYETVECDGYYVDKIDEQS